MRHYPTKPESQHCIPPNFTRLSNLLHATDSNFPPATPSNMASNPRSTSAAGAHEKTYFEQQREALIGEIAMVCPSLALSWGRWMAVLAD